MSKDCVLSSFNNPYDPFTQHDEWETFELEQGFGSFEILDRFAKTSVDLTDEENEAEIERAMDEICDVNPLFVKVIKPDELNEDA